MRNSSILAVAAFALVILPSTGFNQAKDSLSGVVEPGAQPEVVQEGFAFTEGPVGTANGGLYFSDIRANRTYYLDPNGKVTVFREQTNGANGLALTRDGDLLAAEGDGKRITRVSRNRKTTIFAEGIAGMPLMAPNDLIVDAKGGVYFTDPGPRPVLPGRRAYVYYVPAGRGEPIIVNDQITRPNGLTLTRDGKRLLVDDTVGDTVYQFEVQPDGTLKNKQPFARLHDVSPGQESGADGMALDRDGRAYISTVTGVQVFDAPGEYLGTIRIPRQPANLAFAGPEKRTLYITAREALYRLQMAAKGPDRLGK
jgi:gluconolactonase